MKVFHVATKPSVEYPLHAASLFLQPGAERKSSVAAARSKINSLVGPVSVGRSTLLKAWKTFSSGWMRTKFCSSATT
jgi:hypothetical protein